MESLTFSRVALIRSLSSTPISKQGTAELDFTQGASWEQEFGAERRLICCEVEPIAPTLPTFKSRHHHSKEYRELSSLRLGEATANC